MSTAPSCVASPKSWATRGSLTRWPGSTTRARSADTAGWAPDLSVERKVELLEELDPEARLEKALAFVQETLAELDLTEQIRNRVTEGMDKTQREFLLRQQLSAIREELGETGDADDAVAEYRQKLSELVLPADVRARGRARGRPS